jgi:hypothetical protein
VIFEAVRKELSGKKSTMSTGYEWVVPPSDLTARLTVNETMARWPGAISVMRDYGMQPGCCGGLTLAAVAERNNLKVGDLLDTLRYAAAGYHTR